MESKSIQTRRLHIVKSTCLIKTLKILTFDNWSYKEFSTEIDNTGKRLCLYYPIKLVKFYLKFAKLLINNILHT